MAHHSLAAVVQENAERFLGHAEHSHDVPHLIHVVSGTAVVTATGREFPLRERESLWLDTAVPHAMRVEEEGTAVFGPMLVPACRPSTAVVRLGRREAITAVVNSVLVAGPRTEEQLAACRRELSRAVRASQGVRFHVPSPRSRAARGIAAACVDSPLPLGALAAGQYISARQAQRLFREETGLSFVSWRTRARLNEAVPQLLAGVPAAQVARQVGYATTAGLWRALARELGVPVEQVRSGPLDVLAGTPTPDS